MSTVVFSSGLRGKERKGWGSPFLTPPLWRAAVERGYKDPPPLNWDCPSGMVVRMPYSQGKRHGFSPWLGRSRMPSGLALPRCPHQKKRSPAVHRLQIKTVWGLKLLLLQGLRRGLVMRCSEANAVQVFFLTMLSNYLYSRTWYKYGFLYFLLEKHQLTS